MTDQESTQVPLVEIPCPPRSDRIRNLSGFWLLGLCNNFGYVVMLSAAHDILTSNVTPADNGTMPDSPINQSGKLVPDCNPVTTGAVLLADILPTLIVKVTAPFYMQFLPYWFRVGVIVIFGLVSFPVVAVSHGLAVSLLGVVLGSISCGLGEVTFLALSSHFDKDVVSTWSSGTGGSGVFGALSYAGLLAVGFSTRNTLFLMMLIPTALGVGYYILLVKPATLHSPPTGPRPVSVAPNVDESTPLIPSETNYGVGHLENFKHKLKLIVPLLPFMIPLCLVYFAEYFINQGLQELIYFENIWLSGAEQYRWYQVLYQVGVFISRSSVNCFHIKKLWILPMLQMLNVVLLLLQVFYKFIPTIWIVFALILYEGFLGGAGYVNTFYGITEQVKKEDLEYSMGVASVADSFGISLAGVIAIPVHNVICTL